MPYVQDRDIELLFRCMDTEKILEIYVEIMLEHKVLLVSKHTSLLTSAATALISFMFPFNWMHVMIPVVPECMTDCA